MGKNERVRGWRSKPPIFGRLSCISASFSNEIKMKRAIIRSSNMKVAKPRAKFLLEGEISKIKKALKLGRGGGGLNGIIHATREKRIL